MLHLRRTLLVAAAVASLLISTGCSATDVHEGAAATSSSKGRELDEMKCICFPCGGPCDESPPPPPPEEPYLYLSPPPPEEPYPYPSPPPPEEPYPYPSPPPPEEPYPYPSPPPPEEPYPYPSPPPPEEPWMPPRPWSPPRPWPPAWAPPYNWPKPGGALYPVDPVYISGARRSFADGWLPLAQVLLAWCGLLALWI